MKYLMWRLHNGCQWIGSALGKVESFSFLSIHQSHNEKCPRSHKAKKRKVFHERKARPKEKRIKFYVLIDLGARLGSRKSKPLEEDESRRMAFTSNRYRISMFENRNGRKTCYRFPLCLDNGTGLGWHPKKIQFRRWNRLRHRHSVHCTQLLPMLPAFCSIAPRRKSIKIQIYFLLRSIFYNSGRWITCRCSFLPNTEPSSLKQSLLAFFFAQEDKTNNSPSCDKSESTCDKSIFVRVWR